MENESACGHCHTAREQAPDASLPVNEWLQDAHSQSAINPGMNAFCSSVPSARESHLITNRNLPEIVSNKGERIVEIKEDYSPGIPGMYELYSDLTLLYLG